MKLLHHCNVLIVLKEKPLTPKKKVTNVVEAVIELPVILVHKTVTTHGKNSFLFEKVGKKKKKKKRGIPCIILLS